MKSELQPADSSDAKPVNPYAAPRAPVDEPRLIEADAPHPPVGELAARTRLAQTALALTLALTAGVLASDVYVLADTRGGTRPFAGPAWVSSVIQAIASGRVLTYFIASIASLIWFHRASKRARAMVRHRLEFTPGWAVGWWFVPFANLVRPVQMVSELWRVSHGGRAASKHPGVVLGIWWGSWIVTNGLGRGTSVLSDDAELSTQLVLEAAFCCACLVAGSLFLWLLSSIARAQRERLGVA